MSHTYYCNFFMTLILMLKFVHSHVIHFLQLAEVTNTSGSGIPLFPTDLSITNYILINTITALNESFAANNETAGEVTVSAELYL